MCKLPAIITRFLAGLACLLLGACFDIHEEVWIRRDGSGRAELTYTVPESALMLSGGAASLEAKLRALVATEPDIQLEGMTVTTEDERTTVAVKLSTRSMLSLLDLKDNEGFQTMSSSAAGIAGAVDVRLIGLDVDFTRTVKVREALGLASLAIGAEDRDARRLTYIIHLPKKPKESNATSVADDGKTLRWEYSLGDAMKKPVVTHFRANMPIPWFVHAATGGLLLGGVVLVLRVRAKRRQKLEDACMVDL